MQRRGWKHFHAASHLSYSCQDCGGSWRQSSFPDWRLRGRPGAVPMDVRLVHALHFLLVRVTSKGSASEDQGALLPFGSATHGARATAMMNFVELNRLNKGGQRVSLLSQRDRHLAESRPSQMAACQTEGLRGQGREGGLHVLVDTPSGMFLSTEMLPAWAATCSSGFHR